MDGGRRSSDVKRRGVERSRNRDAYTRRLDGVVVVDGRGVVVCVDRGVRVSGMASNSSESSATSGGRPK